jgi:membrane protease YdiL (CAAX protease family)
MSSFCLLLMASRINPSLLINSVYIKSAPLVLQTARKGGSLTSSIGANSRGKSGNDMLSIFTRCFVLYQAYLSPAFLRHKFKNLSLVDSNYNNSKGVSYTSGFFILLGLSILGFVISGFIGAVILTTASGGNLAGLKDALNDPKNADTLKWIQVISVLISMFLPALLTARMLNRKPFQLLGYQKDAEIKQVGIVVAIMFLSLFVAGSFGYLNRAVPLPADWKAKFDAAEKSYADQVEMMVNLKSFGGYVVSLILLAFIPAVCEETLFRGGLQNFLTRATRSPWLAIIVVSILFSVVHFSFYGFLPRMFLGIMLGLIFYYTGNIWLSITGHFLNNALAVTAAYVIARQGKSVKEAMNEDIQAYYWGFLAIPILLLLFSVLRKNKNYGATNIHNH